MAPKPVTKKDRNGLFLSARAGKTVNTYYLTALDRMLLKWQAYTRLSKLNNTEMTLRSVGFYDDPRDAAYVAQAWQRKFSGDDVRKMVENDTFAEETRKFRDNLKIPKWMFPAEGMSAAEIVYYEAATKAAKEFPSEDPKQCLRIALKMFMAGYVPPLAIVNFLFKEMKEETTLSTWEAAKKVIVEHKKLLDKKQT